MVSTLDNVIISLMFFFFGDLIYRLIFFFVHLTLRVYEAKKIIDSWKKNEKEINRKYFKYLFEKQTYKLNWKWNFKAKSEFT